MIARESVLGLYLAALLCGVSMTQCLFVLRESYERRHDSGFERGQDEYAERRTDLYHEFSVAICMCLE